MLAWLFLIARLFGKMVGSQVLTRYFYLSPRLTWSCTLSFFFFFFSFSFYFLSISHLPIPHKPPSTPLQPKNGAGPRLGLSFPALPFPALPFPSLSLRASHFHPLTHLFTYSPPPPPPLPQASPPFSTVRIEIERRA